MPGQARGGHQPWSKGIRASTNWALALFVVPVCSVTIPDVFGPEAEKLVALLHHVRFEYGSYPAALEAERPLALSPIQPYQINKDDLRSKEEGFFLELKAVCIRCFNKDEDDPEWTSVVHGNLRSTDTRNSDGFGVRYMGYAGDPVQSGMHGNN